MDLESFENSTSLNSIVDSELSKYVRRERYDELRDLPVLLLEGPVGSGKTTTLERIHRQWRDSAPVVLVSRVGTNVEPFRVAVAVADELKRRASVPTILFRRLLLGVAALSAKLSANSDLAARELEKQLAQRDTVMRNVATEMNTKTSVQGLVQLNHWGATGNWSAVNSLLMKAFLADLRTPFTSWLNSEKLTSNVVLLLDDVDSAGGHRFLKCILVERRRHQNEHAEGDPIMLVATSGTRVADGDEAPFGEGEPASISSVDLSSTHLATTPLVEKMALFWHQLFATAARHPMHSLAQLEQIEMFRRRGLGRFEDLLLALSRDPAMLFWSARRSARGRPRLRVGGADFAHARRRACRHRL